MTASAKMQWRRQTVADFNRVADQHATKPRAVWTYLDTIIAVVNDFATGAPHNHMFFPVSGGLDLCGATRSHEDGGIELETDGQTVAIVKSVNLQLERFVEDRTGDWTYLRLNLAPLVPTEFHQPQEDSYSEEVAELEPGVYDERSLIEGPDCPPNVRVVTRLFRGALVLFAKGSLYNQDPSTYDGRHSLGLIQQYGREGTPDLFRAIIDTTLEGRDQSSKTPHLRLWTSTDAATPRIRTLPWGDTHASSRQRSTTTRCCSCLRTTATSSTLPTTGANACSRSPEQEFGFVPLELENHFRARELKRCCKKSSIEPRL